MKAFGALALDEARALFEGLFDAAVYRAEARLGRDDDALAHYLRVGAAAGLRPNSVFDPVWYVAQNPEAGDCALAHYIRVGEAADRDPSPLFDVRWYRATYGAERPLAHYLAHRFGPFSPVPEFDADFYLRAYPDVGAARLDPFLHYMHFGYREFRRPRADFDPRRYRNRFLRDDPGANPLAHARAHPHAPPARGGPGPHAEVRAFARRGASYEAWAPPPAGAKPRALALAFHLPQFHRIPENDAWWGEGFTEWTQLARGQPRFAGHYQPRIPGALGFYDLTDPAALAAQAALAKAAGIGAFVFYYYDFGAKRLLERPLDAFLGEPSLDIGFCLMWANENWTRRWDGAEDELLIAQDYDIRHEAKRIADFARHFRDSRYVRLQGRPLLMVYRASLIPETPATLARWRRLFAESHGERPLFVMAQCFDDVDPRPLGFDAAIEFPPHKLTKGLPEATEGLEIFDEDFEAHLYAYDDVVAASLAEPTPDFPLVKTAVPSWDNDARRQGRGLTLAGSRPPKFERWLGELIDRAEPWLGTRLVAINAWNEWGEAAYLEPDAHDGYAYLNAAARALYGLAPVRTRLAVISPEGRASAWARALAAAFGVEIAPAEAAREAGAAIGDEAAELAALAAAGVRVATSPVAATNGLDEASLRALFSQLWPETARVSAILLHDGRGPFAAAGLRAVFAQTHPLFEIVALDAGEGALEIVDAEARAADRDVALVLDVADPWKRIADMAAGDFIWIRESQGWPDPRALATLVAALTAEPAAALAFADSLPVDAQGAPIHRRPTLLGPARPAVAVLSVEGAALAAGRAIPPFGAALWRRDAFAHALEVCGGQEVDGPSLIRAAAAREYRCLRVAEALEFQPAPARTPSG